MYKDIALDAGQLLSSAQRTIQTEMAGLTAVHSALDGALGAAFCEVAELISGITGRVIVTGVGKSGHIAKKVAATLASTGTPSFFVHPSEANHGDLGMIGHDDVVIALSWSGETAELQGVLAYSRRFSIPLIAITSGARSALARAAEYKLILPKRDEACPHGLAPTTSALMQLAICDALAVSLLEAKGFSADDFKIYHPGGKLGASLAKVSEIMHVGEEIPLVKIGTLVPAAAMEIARKRFGCVGIVDDDGLLSGILTDGDIARHMERPMREVRVEEIMTTAPKTIKCSTLAMSAMALLNQHNISALLVVDENGKRVDGIVGLHDLLRLGVA